MHLQEKIKNRFYKKFIYLNGCWEWTDYISNDGYGQIRINQKMLRAHRISFILHGGRIPKNKWVLHHCDNRKCVNPDHLYVGNREDNIRDMLVRKRHGSSNKTKCKKGHKYDLLNTRIYRNRRYCRLCDKIRKKKVWKV